MTTLARVVIKIAAAFVAAVLALIACVGSFIWSAEARADRIKRAHERLKGSAAILLAREFRAPDKVEIISPFAWQTETGEITARYEPYVVWSYYPWPKVCPCLPLRVFIDEKTGKITRFKSPGD